MTLQHTADTNSYYILLRGDQVTAILTAKDMQFGSVGTNHLKDPNLATNAGFYRVRQVPLSNPLDTDSDGIDDVCELKYRPLLDPLNPNDANLDPDGDGRTTLEECAANRNPFVADLPEVTTISYPTNATTASFVIFSGVATTNTLIRVEGGAAYVTNAVGAGGAFDVTIALNPNRLNRLFVSAVDEYGNVSAPVPIDILQDSVAPYLFIDFPTNGAVLTTSNTLVAGRVGDAFKRVHGSERHGQWRGGQCGCRDWPQRNVSARGSAVERRHESTHGDGVGPVGEFDHEERHGRSRRTGWAATVGRLW